MSNKSFGQIDVEWRADKHAQVEEGFTHSAHFVHVETNLFGRNIFLVIYLIDIKLF